MTCVQLVYVLVFYTDTVYISLSPEPFAPNTEINACSQRHTSLISENVCNDSVSVCHSVGHAATQSAVLYVCVALQLLHKPKPRALALPQEQLQKGSGNT